MTPLIRGTNDKGKRVFQGGPSAPALGARVSAGGNKRQQRKP